MYQGLNGFFKGMAHPAERSLFIGMSQITHCQGALHVFIAEKIPEGMVVLPEQFPQQTLDLIALVGLAKFAAGHKKNYLILNRKRQGRDEPVETERINA